jgi:hypothetical protein
LSFLGLAFCVFVWGLQYKLSLYDPPQAVSHTIPTAKLLSKNEQPAAGETPLIRKVGVSDGEKPRLLLPLALPLLATLSLFYRPALINRDSDAERPWQLYLQASLNHFFFRPPPILA